MIDSAFLRTGVAAMSGGNVTITERTDGVKVAVSDGVKVTAVTLTPEEAYVVAAQLNNAADRTKERVVK